MKQTVVGVFDRYAAAQQAARTLEDSGFDHDHVHVTGTDAEADTAAAPEAQRDEGVLASIRNFFADLFGPDDSREVGAYAEAVRRGGAVVKVDVEEDAEADRARAALQEAGAVDIDERVESWRASGWNPDSESERTLDEDGEADLARSRLEADTHMDSDAELRRSAPSRDADRRDEGAIPVVKEELAVGKRAVNTGGVRVYSRVVEKPVEESVELRTERAEVRREPVDRPATEADLARMQDRTIEVREMTEKPVVQKDARVVEEVSVDKHVENRTETVRDTVRSTEVEVEQLGRSERGAELRDDTLRADAALRDSGLRDETMGGSALRRFAFEDHASDFRRDFDSRYAASGARYEEYEPAYRYGHGLGADPRYAGRAWDDIETDVRSDWEQRHPGSAWERFKASVRHAWERATD